MSSVSLTTILGNLSLSLLPVQSLVAGIGYLAGIACVISGLMKLSKVNKQSREGASVAMAYIVGGVVLIYLPTSMRVATATLFGTSCVLQYNTYSAYSLYAAMRVLIQTSGLIWFVRGVILMVHAAEPGKQHGPKGLGFVIAGVCSMNFDYTVKIINAIVEYFISLTMKLL